jgi:hypothetical protein
MWIVMQIYLGPMIGQLTQIHGIIQRMFGWFLMLILAKLTGRFGRVTTMTIIASLATRIIRPGPIYSLFVGLGYAMGGFTFDLLYTFSFDYLENRSLKIYLLGISIFSGIIAFIPYLLLKFSSLGFYGFTIWIPFYSISMLRSLILNVLGTSIGISILPQIEVWSSKVKIIQI